MKNDEGWMKNDVGWKMNDEERWFQAVEGFGFMTDEWTDRQTYICDCRVAFMTEKAILCWCVSWFGLFWAFTNRIFWICQINTPEGSKAGAHEM